MRIPLDQNHIGAPETAFHITIVDPVIVAPLSADRTRIVGGTVAGTLDPDAVAKETIRIAAGVLSRFCDPDEAATLADSVWSLADIHADFPGRPRGGMRASFGRLRI